MVRTTFAIRARFLLSRDPQSRAGCRWGVQSLCALAVCRAEKRYAPVCNGRWLRLLCRWTMRVLSPLSGSFQRVLKAGRYSACRVLFFLSATAFRQERGISPAKLPIFLSRKYRRLFRQRKGSRKFWRRRSKFRMAVRFRTIQSRKSRTLP